MREHALDNSESVLRPDSAPLIPAENGRSIDENNLLDIGGRTTFQEQARTHPHRLQRVARLCRHDLCGDVGDEVSLDLFIHRREEGRLVAELVIQGAPRHPRRLDDRLGGDVGKALVGEELPCGVD